MGLELRESVVPSGIGVTELGGLSGLSASVQAPKVGFGGVHPAATGRPAYHPSTLPKIYLYGYLNRVQSSRRLEREAQRNIELMWLTGRLAPEFKTIANFDPLQTFVSSLY